MARGDTHRAGCGGGRGCSQGRPEGRAQVCSPILTRTAREWQGVPLGGTLGFVFKFQFKIKVVGEGACSVLLQEPPLIINTQ